MITMYEELNPTAKIDSDFVIYDNGNPTYLYIHTTKCGCKNIYVVLKYDCLIIHSIVEVPEDATYGDYMEDGQKAYKIQKYSIEKVVAGL